MPIDSGGDSLIDRAEVRPCTSHTLVRSYPNAPSLTWTLNPNPNLTPCTQAKLFTSHTSLKPVRRAFNQFPWSGLSLPSLRAQFGLEASITWKAAFRRRRPSKASRQC